MSGNWNPDGTFTSDFSEADLKVIDDRANPASQRSRYVQSRRDGADPNTRFHPTRNQYEVDLDGCLGEAAYQQMQNIPIELESNAYKPSDVDLHDLTNSVRSTRHKYGCFILNKGEEFVCDIGWLSWVESDTKAHIVGWIPRDEFMRIRTQRDFGKGLRWNVQRLQMRIPADYEKWRNGGTK